MMVLKICFELLSKILFHEIISFGIRDIIIKGRDVSSVVFFNRHISSIKIKKKFKYLAMLFSILNE